jgi:hypothetical protein
VQQRQRDGTDEVPDTGLGKNQAVNPIRMGTHEALGHIAAEGGADHMCGRDLLGVEDGGDAGNQVGHRAGRWVGGCNHPVLAAERLDDDKQRVGNQRGPGEY